MQIYILCFQIYIQHDKSQISWPGNLKFCVPTTSSTPIRFWYGSTHHPCQVSLEEMCQSLWGVDNMGGSHRALTTRDCTLSTSHSHIGHIPNYSFNSFGPSDAIWRCRSGSTLAQVMACCLTAPSHYLNQCWLIISNVHWHSYEGNLTLDALAINH